MNIVGITDTTKLMQVYRLFTTMAGTIPFDRNFGIDPDILDDLPSSMEGRLLVEYEEKLMAYFPEFTISSLTFGTSDNKIIPTVVIADA
jgi:hypothetical protein